MPEIFIAYPQPDRLIAVRLWDELRYRGIRVGIDLQDVPAQFDRRAVLEDIVSRCDLLLLFVSGHAAVDDELRRLHLLAIEQDCDVVALLLPGGKLPNVLKCAKTLLFGNYERGIKHLLRLIPEQYIHQHPDPQQILSNLRHDNPDVRRANLFMVAKQKMDAAIPRTVTLMLSDYNASVRATAAWALDQISNADTANALILALFDDEFNVRSNAGWALVNIARRKDSPATRAVIHSIIHTLSDKENPYETREMAYLILRRIGGRAAYDAIDRYWED